MQPRQYFGILLIAFSAVGFVYDFAPSLPVLKLSAVDQPVNISIYHSFQLVSALGAKFKPGPYPYSYSVDSSTGLFVFKYLEHDFAKYTLTVNIYLFDGTLSRQYTHTVTVKDYGKFLIFRTYLLPSETKVVVIVRSGNMERRITIAPPKLDVDEGKHVPRRALHCRGVPKKDVMACTVQQFLSDAGISFDSSTVYVMIKSYPVLTPMQLVSVIKKVVPPGYNVVVLPSSSRVVMRLCSRYTCLVSHPIYAYHEQSFVAYPGNVISVVKVVPSGDEQEVPVEEEEGEEGTIVIKNYYYMAYYPNEEADNLFDFGSGFVIVILPVCKGTPDSCCTDADCKPFCKDNVAYYDGHCTIPGKPCNYAKLACPVSCLNGQCVTECEEKEIALICQGNNVYRQYQTKDCKILMQKVKDCSSSEICRNGQCVPYCEPVQINQTCIGNSVYGYFRNSDCSIELRKIKDCQQGTRCISGSCVRECSDMIIGKPYCIGNALYVDHLHPDCTVTRELNKTCNPGEVCLHGECVSTACDCPSKQVSACRSGLQIITYYTCSANTDYKCVQHTDFKNCSYCGNGFCEPEEDWQTCWQDCGTAKDIPKKYPGATVGSVTLASGLLMALPRRP